MISVLLLAGGRSIHAAIDLESIHPGISLVISSSSCEPLVLQGIGTAFCVSKDGHYITNSHVVGFEKNNYLIVREDPRVLILKARIVWRDWKKDLAVIKVDLEDAQPLGLSTTTPKLLDGVVVIGYPGKAMWPIFEVTDFLRKLQQTGWQSFDDPDKKFIDLTIPENFEGKISSFRKSKVYYTGGPDRLAYAHERYKDWPLSRIQQEILRKKALSSVDPGHGPEVVDCNKLTEMSKALNLDDRIINVISELKPEIWLITQTTAMGRGNSGGPLVDSETGNVIGINTLMRPASYSEHLKQSVYIGEILPVLDELGIAYIKAGVKGQVDMDGEVTDPDPVNPKLVILLVLFIIIVLLLAVLMLMGGTEDGMYA
jgi:hypothetical protein